MPGPRKMEPVLVWMVVMIRGVCSGTTAHSMWHMQSQIQY
jgi:hypothetical protein